MKVFNNGDFKMLAGNYRKLQESTGTNRKDKLVKKMKSRAKMAFQKKSRHTQTSSNINKIVLYFLKRILFLYLENGNHEKTLHISENGTFQKNPP